MTYREKEIRDNSAILGVLLGGMAVLGLVGLPLFHANEKKYEKVNALEQQVSELKTENQEQP